MVTELGGSQISSLLETLPGIANVLRSPVADALINVIRASARLGDFNLSDAEELIHYATRRGLVGNSEGDRVLADVREAYRKRMDKSADRVKAAKARARAGKAGPKHKPHTKSKPKARKRSSLLARRSADNAATSPVPPASSVRTRQNTREPLRPKV